MPSSSLYSLLTFISTSLPFHNISSSVPSTAVDIEYFLKPFTVTSDGGVLPYCYDSHWLNNTVTITLHSYIQYSGLVALSTVCLVLLLLMLTALTMVSNMVLHRFTNPLTPHNAVPQLQSLFTLMSTLTCSGMTVSLSCCPLALYAACSMSWTFFTVPFSPWYTLLEFSASFSYRNGYHTGSLDSGFAGCHTTRRCCPLLQYIYIFWFINSLESMKIHSFLHRWHDWC